MSSPGEIWQVMVNGEVYDADFDTLKQWIVEGAVQPQDKVRRGKLSWLEAGRVPALRGAFGEPGAQAGLPSTLAPPSAPTYGAQPTYGSAPPYEAGAAGGPGPAVPAFAPVVCQNHAYIPATYACAACGAGYCNPCRKIVNNVTLCSACGHFCKPVRELRQQAAVRADFEKGFGLEDLARAILFPLGDPVELICMTLVCGLLLLLGFWGKLAALGIILSSMSVVIHRLSMGNLDDSPMTNRYGPGPGAWSRMRGRGVLFGSFGAKATLFEMVFEPLKLAVGIAIITFGPLILAVYLGLSAVVASFASQEPALGRMGFALILGIFGLVWAAFYFPMALLVAGFTESFFATINPVVGFDTIWRMGRDYAKAYGMCLVAGVIQYCLAFLFHLMTVTDNRSIPAAAMVLLGYILEGGTSYYLYMVVAAILGLALFKCSDKLELGPAR